MEKYMKIGMIIFISSIVFAQNIDNTVPPYVVPLIIADTAGQNHIYQFNAVLLDPENGLFVADVNAVEFGDLVFVHIAGDIYPVEIPAEDCTDRDANIAIVKLTANPLPLLPQAAPLANESPMPSDSTVVIVKGHVGGFITKNKPRPLLQLEEYSIPCAVKTVHMNDKGQAYMDLRILDNQTFDIRLSGAVVLSQDGYVVGIFDVNYGILRKALPIYKVKELLDHVQFMLPIYELIDQHEQEKER